MKRRIVPLLISLSATLASTSAMAGGGTSVLPLGWIDGDISNKLINQGTSKAAGAAGVELAPADQTAGYRQVKSYSLDLKLGVYGGWSFDNATFATSMFGAGAALLPTVGSTVIADRFVQNEQDTANLPDPQIPAKAEGLASWKAHDNIYYAERGGIIFAVGIGYAFTGLSGDYFAQGEWATYVEKLDDKHVFVKITNTSLSDFDEMLGNYVAYQMLSDFKKVGNFFSYVIDVSDSRGAAAYEAMIHGSMKEVQELADKAPSVAQLDLTEKGESKGYQNKLFFGLPFLNVSSTSGSLCDMSDTTYHMNNSKSDVEYGLYWKENASVLFSHHKSSAQLLRRGLHGHDRRWKSQFRHLRPPHSLL